MYQREPQLLLVDFRCISLESYRGLPSMGEDISMQCWDYPVRCRDYASIQVESLVGDMSIIGVCRRGYEHLMLGAPLRVSRYVDERSLNPVGIEAGSNICRR